MNRSGLILIADDDKNDVSLLSSALKKAGISNPIRWLKDGDAVVNSLRLDEKHVDYDVYQWPFLLLIDWNMPRTSTQKVLKWIRQQPQYLNFLVIVLTGSDDPVQKQLAFEAGANWHFVKSVDFADLTLFVQRLKEFWLYAVGPEPGPTDPFTY